VKLYDVIRSARSGAIVKALATQAGLEASEAEQALRALLPELGRAIRRAREQRGSVPAVRAALWDERYALYLEDPAALGEPAAVADGERVLADALDVEQRRRLVDRVAAAIGPDEGKVAKLLPLVATLAMAALGQQLREPSPGIPWFGTRPDDHFDAPLLNALAALFEHEDEPPKGR
jgi:hypothetical protein